MESMYFVRIVQARTEKACCWYLLKILVLLRIKRYFIFALKNICVNIKKRLANVIIAYIIPEIYKNIDKSITYADAIKLQFKYENFNMVITNHILEHIPEDAMPIKKINRIRKKKEW